MAYKAASVIESNLDVLGYNGVVGHIGQLSQIILGLASRAPYLIEFDGGEIRGRTDEAGQIDVFLPPSIPFSLSIYNLDYNIVGRHEGKTSLSGMPTVIQSIPYVSSDEDIDSDNDGLSDIAEQILGSNLRRGDTDSDGISDFAEVQAGQDPLGGFSLPTGLVGSLNLQGQSLDIALVADSANLSTRLALVATGNGLSVVDLSNALSPSLVNRLPLTGNADSAAYDPTTRLAAVTTSGSLVIINLSTPTTPSLVRSVAVAAEQVEVLDGVVYLISGSELRSYDLTTGDILASLSLGSTLNGLARDGTTLYVRDVSNRIRVVEAIDGTGAVLSLRGSLTLPSSIGNNGERKLFVAEGILYVPADDGFQGGYATVDVRNPAAPALLSAPDDRSLAGHAIALTGSGRAVIVGNPGGVFGTNAADVINTNDPLNTGAFITRISMPSRPNDVAIVNGFAYVASDSGLQVVNFLPRDVNGLAPSVSINSSGLDLDPSTPGLQVQEGSAISLNASLADDVLISRVDVLLNDQVIRSDVTYPYDLRIKLPTQASNGGSNVTVQLRASDMAGNVAASLPLILQLTPDQSPPHLVGGSLRDGAQIGRSTRSLTLVFSEPVTIVDSAESVFNLQGPNGSPLAISNTILQSSGKQIRFTLANLLQRGSHRFTINGSLLRDLAGNPLSNGPLNLGFTVPDLIGTNGNDNLIGTDTDDLISPLRGRDVVDGSDGSDVLIIDYSSNVYAGNTPAAGIYSYVYSGGSGYYQAYFNSGYNYDSISFSNIEQFQITGTNAADQIATGAGDDTINSGGGNDTINSGTGNDIINAGEGNDQINNASGLDSVDGGLGIDTIDTADFSTASTDLSIDDSDTGKSYSITGGIRISNVERFTNVTGGSGNDLITYSRRINNTIKTGAGNDRINTGLGNDNVDGGLGSDTLIIDYSSNTFAGSAPAAGIYSYFYGNGSGTFQAYIHPNYSYDNVSFSNIEQFQITGTTAADQIDTGAGDDTINSGGGNDTINSGAGNDIINAGEGNDQISNASGLDSVDGGLGIDTIDTADFSTASTDLSIDDTDTGKSYNIAGGIRISNVERFTNMTLGSGNDLLTYSRRITNTIKAGSGNDRINAGLGNDNVDGGVGSDTLIIDYSSNTYAGSEPAAGISGYANKNGSGYFQAYFNASYGRDTISFSNIEQLQITGTIAADQIDTGAGDDTINSGGGNDTINSGAGNDIISAGAGNDILTGGLGADRLLGGPGADQFLYVTSDEGGDQITDFDGAVDFVKVSASGFGGQLIAGMNILASGRYVANITGLSTSADGVGQFIYQTTTNQLLWDSDGAGGLSALSIITFESPQSWSGSRIQVGA